MRTTPERPAGDLYCRVPQDSDLNVRGVRNIPCENNPAKRAPTVEICESDEQYVPLNDGYNWKGDPNATLSGQGMPQYPPGTDPRLAPPLGSTALPNAGARLPPRRRSPSFRYDPATGTYVGPEWPDPTRSPTWPKSTKGKTWQDMLIPPSR